VVLPYTTRHWKRFFELAGRADLASAAWVMDPESRSNRVHELYGLIGACLPSRSTEEWLRLLSEAEIPASPVNTLDNVIDDPHLGAVNFWRLVEHPTEGTLRTMRHPLDFDDIAPRPDRPAPRLGADSVELLEEVGYSPDEIRSLVAEGAVQTG
jgi:crotonobetainyl-CoA:carnitine CoA-transferase CaiB-like acyl-CoA transferase